MNPYNFILLCLAGWINREQQAVIEYLQEEIRVLKEVHGRSPRFNDRQRRRYHRERNHQGLESRIIQPQFRDGGVGEVECRERLGGLLNFYCREAA